MLTLTKQWKDRKAQVIIYPSLVSRVATGSFFTLSNWYLDTGKANMLQPSSFAKCSWHGNTMSSVVTCKPMSLSTPIETNALLVPDNLFYDWKCFIWVRNLIMSISLNMATFKNALEKSSEVKENTRLLTQKIQNDVEIHWIERNEHFTHKNKTNKNYYLNDLI